MVRSQVEDNLKRERTCEQNRENSFPDFRQLQLNLNLYTSIQNRRESSVSYPKARLIFFPMDNFLYSEVDSNSSLGARVDHNTWRLLETSPRYLLTLHMKANK